MPKRPGPPQQSADVVVLGGNRSKLSDEQIAARRRAEASLTPRPLRPKPPADLTIVERECWDLHAPELERLGLLSVLDSGAFRLACSAYALAMAALESMRPRKADGTPDERKKSFEVVVGDPAHGGGLKRHPGTLIFSVASKEYRGWCVEFGLTPSARVGLRPGRQAPPLGEDDGEDADDSFFGT